MHKQHLRNNDRYFRTVRSIKCKKVNAERAGHGSFKEPCESVCNTQFAAVGAHIRRIGRAGGGHKVLVARLIQADESVNGIGLNAHLSVPFSVFNY